MSGAVMTRAASKACLIAGLTLIAYGLSIFLLPFAYQSWLSVNASNPAPGAVEGPTAPAAKSPLPNGVKAQLSCQRLGQELFVLPEAGLNLMKGPVWLNQTAEAGKGNSIVAAHRDTHFRFLKDIKVGDVFELQTNSQTFSYKVTGLSKVSPKDRRLLKPQSTSVLTLVTCYPFYYIGSAPQRFIVRARQIDTGSYQSISKTPEKVSPGVVQ